LTKKNQPRQAKARPCLTAKRECTKTARLNNSTSTIGNRNNSGTIYIVKNKYDISTSTPFIMLDVDAYTILRNRPSLEVMLTRLRPTKMRILKLIGIVIGLLIFFPIAEVGLMRFFNPPITSLMIIRRVEGFTSKRYRGEIRYHWVPLRTVSEPFLNAVWQMEDARFFVHDGFDWLEIQKAMHKAEKRHDSIRGVSTISMQCARSLFLWTGRSWVRKGIEAYYTFLMEHLLTKARILELYVNVVELGDGIYGIQAASEHYYHLSARSLRKDQCAMLAAMLPFPRGWNPYKPSPKLYKRYVTTLQRMNDGGSIERRLGFR
jgi:monofunctional glycosyltransferase